MDLILSGPELRGHMLSQFADGISLLAGVVADRTGRPAHDPAVRALAVNGQFFRYFRYQNYPGRSGPMPHDDSR